MTLQDVFDHITATPEYMLVYIISFPVLALTMSLFSYEKRHESPVNYFYTVLIYGTAVPGLFILTLNAYVFLFEKQSIMNMNVLIHILPLITMILTFVIIKGQVNLRLIPGFDRLWGLFLMLLTLLIILWVIDRTSFRVFSYLPFSLAIIIFIGLVIVMRLGWGRFIRQ